MLIPVFPAEITQKVKKGRNDKQDRERNRESIVNAFTAKTTLKNFINPLDETILCGSVMYVPGSLILMLFVLAPFIIMLFVNLHANPMWAIVENSLRYFYSSSSCITL